MAGSQGSPASDESVDAGWSKAENLAWDKIRAGDIADFSAEHGELDVRAETGWDGRTLGPAFLSAILFEKRWIERIPIEGVRIAGARWTEPLDIPHGDLKWPLCLERCRFEGPVDMTGFHIEGRLSLSGSMFKGTSAKAGLNLDGATIRRVDLSSGIFSNGFSATGAVIDSAFDLKKVSIQGVLDLGRSKAGCLFLRNASAQIVKLTNFETDQDIDLSGATLDGALDLEDVRVGQDLLLGGNEDSPAIYRDRINLLGGFVGGSVDLTGASVSKELEMNGLEIKKHLFMRGLEATEDDKGKTIFEGPIDLSYAVIHGHLEFTAATFKALDMTGILVEEDLSAKRFGSKCTTFGGRFVLAAGRIKGMANFTAAHFQGPVDFAAARLEAGIALDGAIFEHEMTMPGIRVGRHFHMKERGRARPRCKGANLQNATIDGDFELNATCTGSANLSGIQVGHHLSMLPREGKVPRSRTGATIFRKHVDLSYATIKGRLDLDHVRFHAGLTMDSIDVGRDLRLSAMVKGPIAVSRGNVGGSMIVATSTEYKVAMRGLHVGQDLNLNGKFGPATDNAKARLEAERRRSPDPNVSTYGETDLRDLQVDRDLYLGGTFHETVKLSQTRIERVLDATDADFEKGVDLSASTIGDQLRVRLPSWRHSPSPILDLRDANAGSLYIPEQVQSMWPISSWPPNGSVQLDGFTYGRLGGTGVRNSEDMIQRHAKWFRKWLRLDEPYSPQPYEHLAGVMRQAGQAEKANSILYYGRKRERSAAWDPPPEPLSDATPLRYFKAFERAMWLAWLLRATARWFGMSLLQWSTGYGIGYRYFRALFWALLLTAFGMWMLGPGPVINDHKVVLAGFMDKAAYSFDQLLPIIELNHSFGDVKLPPGVEHYFYIHKLLGFLLGTFIAAGIAGLTQRSKS